MSIRNLHSLNRRKYKRAVNALVKTFNKDIENDWLWNGRFVITQDWNQFHPYADHSGAQYIVGLTITDKKTRNKHYAYFDNYNIEWKMWQWANECIMEYWNIWKENPDPNEQARLEGRKPQAWPN